MYIYEVAVKIESPVELYADSFLQEIITEGQKVQAEVEDVASVSVLGIIDDYED